MAGSLLGVPTLMFLQRESSILLPACICLSLCAGSALPACFCSLFITFIPYLVQPFLLPWNDFNNLSSLLIYNEFGAGSRAGPPAVGGTAAQEGLAPRAPPEGFAASIFGISEPGNPRSQQQHPWLAGWWHCTCRAHRDSSSRLQLYSFREYLILLINTIWYLVINI